MDRFCLETYGEKNRPPCAANTLSAEENEELSLELKNTIGDFMGISIDNKLSIELCEKILQTLKK
jgi:hypothetical protein